MAKEKIKIITAKPFLLPPRPDLCQTCAVKHNPELPHNATSFYYQTKFNMDHGRAATWEDAMAHCTPEMKETWIEVLNQRGVDVKAGQVTPTIPPKGKMA